MNTYDLSKLTWDPCVRTPVSLRSKADLQCFSVILVLNPVVPLLFSWLFDADPLCYRYLISFNFILFWFANSHFLLQESKPVCRPFSSIWNHVKLFHSAIIFAKLKWFSNIKLTPTWKTTQYSLISFFLIENNQWVNPGLGYNFIPSNVTHSTFGNIKIFSKLEALLAWYYCLFVMLSAILTKAIKNEKAFNKCELSLLFTFIFTVLHLDYI